MSTVRSPSADNASVLQIPETKGGGVSVESKSTPQISKGGRGKVEETYGERNGMKEPEKAGADHYTV